MNFYKQLIISYFFFVLKNLILISYQIISSVNKSFRTKLFLSSSVNDKNFEKFINSIQISDIEMMVEKSIINQSNQIYLSKLKKFLSDTQQEDEPLREVIEENNYFVVLININDLFSLYNQIFPDQIVKNDFTNENPLKIFNSIDIAVQYFFQLNKEDYLIKSLGLTLNYFDEKMNNLNIWNEYCDIITERSIKPSKNQFEKSFELEELLNNPLVKCQYSILDYYDDDVYEGNKELEIFIGIIDYHLCIKPTKFSTDILYFIIMDLYFYLQPIKLSETNSKSVNKLQDLDNFIIKNIKPLFLRYNKVILENKDKWN
jgi:hypothetical protein